MRLHDLTKVVKSPKKRVGRGHGSGRGKTSGRGTKGAKARGKISLGFIGGTLALYKRLPLNRGWGNRKSTRSTLALDISKLAVFKAKSLVNLQSLVDAGVITPSEAKKKGVKIVGKNNLSVALTVSLPVSKPAQAAIEKAGGTIERG